VFKPVVKTNGREDMTAHDLCHFAGTMTVQVGNLVETMAWLRPLHPQSQPDLSTASVGPRHRRCRRAVSTAAETVAAASVSGDQADELNQPS
jgi:hypothetical protein